MADEKERGDRRRGAPDSSKRGNQPIRPMVVTDEQKVETGLQPIKPADPPSKGDPGTGGGKKSD